MTERKPDLAEIRKRCEKATDPPWRACAWDPMERPHVHKDRPDQQCCRPPDLPLTADDAHFIAHAREDVPDLLAHVGQLAGQSESWEEIAKQHCRNEEFWRGIVIDVGRLLGPEVYVQDDGGVSEDPLALKIVPLLKERLGGR
tara:strand:- start:61 stop:489 length:429 start_codon:yes stop_codon:yes gene_type:complete